MLENFLPAQVLVIPRATRDATRAKPARTISRKQADTGSWFIEVAPGDNHQHVRFFLYAHEGKTVKNRLHLDIHASAGRGVSIETRREQVDAEVERLVALGARVNRVFQEPGIDHYAVTLYDPEGNEFCVN